MKILIVSDTHRRDGNLKEVLARSGPLDMLIHLGDAEGSEGEIASWSMRAATWSSCWEIMTFSPIWTGKRRL